MPQNILVIEDESAIRRGVADALRASGYHAVEALDGTGALEQARRQEFDLVLLDLLLPKRDGIQVLADLRQMRPALPVIILTACGAEPDRVAGLKAGADDYVVKPFSARELLARVEAVLRRSSGRPQPISTARIGRAEIDFARREIRRPENPDRLFVELSDTEWALLQYLVTNRHRAVSRDELLGQIWGISDGVQTRTIDMHVARLRNKLREAAGADDAVITVRGQGYMAGRDITIAEAANRL